MPAMKTWSVEILIGEIGDRTEAEAQLYDEIRDDLIGTGVARANTGEPNIPPSRGRCPIWDTACWWPPPATWRTPPTNT